MLSSSKIKELHERYKQAEHLRSHVNRLIANDIDHIDIVLDDSHITLKLTSSDLDFECCKQFLISKLNRKILSIKEYFHNIEGKI